MQRVRALHPPLPRAKKSGSTHVAINEELRPSKRPAYAGHATLLPLLGLAALAAAVCFLVAGRHAGHEAHTPAPFLVGALGEEQADPPAPVRAGTATARIDAGRLVVEGQRQERVGLSARTAGDPRWKRHADGEWRATPFGSEAIMLGTDDPEHFLTVDRRVGREDVGLAPRDELDTSAAARRRRRLRRPGHPSRLRPDDRPGGDLRFRGRRRHAGRPSLAARQGQDPRVGLEG